MARGDIPKEKKKLKGKKKNTIGGMMGSSAPVFVLPRLLEKKKKQY